MGEAPRSGVDIGCASSHERAEAQWPLSYQLRLTVDGEDAIRRSPSWWSYELYRGPEGRMPRLLYSKTKAESEEIAQEFMSEHIIGFDMEWPWEDDKSDRLQNKIGLIQVASESRIALFHIGLHNGKTTKDLIAPSLRMLIESPRHIKVGVGILNADFARLHKHFDLRPRGAFELSHLHRLVTFGGKQPEKLTNALVALAKQVEGHLGLPLFKGKVRTSNWSRPLKRDQILYAANDAYAGFMLYHCLNAKRQIMESKPPLPLRADLYNDGYQAMNRTPIRALLLQPTQESESVITAMEWFQRAAGDASSVPSELAEILAPETVATPEKASIVKQTTSQQASSDKTRKQPLPQLEGSENELFQSLSQLRKKLATEQQVPPYVIAHNSLLEELARHRPRSLAELKGIKGMGPKKSETYGSQILHVIQQFVAEKSISPGVARASDRNSRRRTEKLPSPGKTPEATPLLSTGLSFSMENTMIDTKESHEVDHEALGPFVGVPAATDLQWAQCADSRTGSSPRHGQQQREWSPLPNAPQGNSNAATSQVRQALYPREPIQYSPDAEKELSSGPGNQASHEQNATAVSTFASHMVSVVYASPLANSHSSTEAPPPPGTSEQLAPSLSPAFAAQAPYHPNQRSVEILDPATRILQKKLIAFSRMMAGRLNPKPSGPILTENSARIIAAKPPRTNQELLKIPGILPLVQACSQAKVNLLDTIGKWTSDSG